MIGIFLKIYKSRFFCHSERSEESDVIGSFIRFFTAFRMTKGHWLKLWEIFGTSFIPEIKCERFLKSFTFHILTILLIFTFQNQLLTQTEPLSNLRQKTIELTQNPQKLDSLTIVPESVILINSETKDTISKENYKIENQKIRLTDPSTVNRQPSTVFYRTLPYDLTAKQTRLDSTKLKKRGDRIIGLTFDPYEEQEESILEFQKGLNYSGSFARGISVGNSQNLVLNSNFNLQMSGDLGDGMEVLAAITDNNIPLQPEGNTQQLSEFDKIFIQITKDENKLIAGDYELARPPGYFMNYFKKLQGGTYSRQFTVGSRQKPRRAPLTPKGGPSPARGNERGGFSSKRAGGGSPLGVRGARGGILNSQASVAVARGKFARNTIQAQEGNQGPYRLEGAENERFIIILAGTERVWVDGVLMKRGIEEDYIIDYNAGHITFTPKRLMTKDIRLIIEFEYADQNYLRSMYAVNLDYQQGEKFRLYFNVFSQQDGKKPVEDDFSPAESLALQNAGDNPLNSVVSSIAPVDEFSAFRVLYEVRDSLDFDSVLVYSTDDEARLFSAFFSFVGAGNGDYVIDPTVATNGRVYRWIAPEIVGDSMIHFGEYAPVRQLVSPKQQQLYTLGTEYQFSKKSKVKAEIGLSNNDLNRLSNLDEDDNLGVAAFTEFENDFEFGKKDEWKLETDLSYEVCRRPISAFKSLSKCGISTRLEYSIQSKSDGTHRARRVSIEK